MNTSKKKVKIELRNVTKKFGKVVALQNVSLTVYEGEYLVILGPSGAGKTTLLRIISGVTKPTQGKILVDNRDITKVPAEERKIAFLPQNYALFPKMNVWNNVTFSPRMQGLAKEQIYEIGSEVLQLVHLRERSDAYPHELSGGMKQRTALARSLAAGFNILLLDEPLRALDARLRLELRSELRDLSEKLKYTVLHVTHDQEEALSVADRIVILNNGRIEQVGTPEEIYLQPANPFVARFMSEVNEFQVEIQAFEEKITDTPEKLYKYNFKTIDDYQFTFTTSTPLDKNNKYILIAKAESLRLIKRHQNMENDEILQEEKEKISQKENLLKGKVLSKSYLGKWTNIEVELEKNENKSKKVETKNHTKKLIIKVPSLTATRFKTGEKVYVEFDPKYFFLFPI